MPYGDDLHKEIVSGALNLVESIVGDARLAGVHISMDIAGSNEFGSYITIKFAKPNSADPISWALVDFKENGEDNQNRISSMVMSWSNTIPRSRSTRSAIVFLLSLCTFNP